MNEVSDWDDIEAQLQEAKELLTEVEQRFLQVRSDSIKQDHLQIQQKQIRAELQDISGEQPLSNGNPKIRRKPNTKSLNTKTRRSPVNLHPINPHKEELLKQLQQVDDRLEQIEADLESRLLSWSSFHEPFWQIVRFVGLGIIIGVILRSCAS